MSSVIQRFHCTCVVTAHFTYISKHAFGFPINSRKQSLVSITPPLYLASFPGLPCFCSSVCIQYNTRKRKSTKTGSSASVYYTERKPKNKKRGRPGNEATLYLHLTFLLLLNCCNTFPLIVHPFFTPWRIWLP